MWTIKKARSIPAKLKKRYLSKRFSYLSVQFFSLVFFGLGIGVGIAFLSKDLISQIFASDQTQVWDLTTSGDYTVSEATLIEVVGGVAQLKIREYSSDAQTALLLHLNESSGNPIDSSSHAHTTTANNVSFQSGQLQNAAVFNSTSSSILADDSAALSVTGAHTLEAWTKFDTTFQAGAIDHRQGIIDKGDYQLYYDNETGKLVYELADSQATTWIQHAGNNINNSWDQSGKITVDSLTVIGSDVYVGLGNQVGDAHVWKWNGSTWTRIGGDGLNNSWNENTYETIYSMATDGTNLYVGLGLTAGEGEVWRWNGSTWFKVGGDAQYNSWLVNSIEGVYSLYYQNGTLYAGLGLTADDSEVWSCSNCETDTPSWVKIGGDNGNAGINGSWTGADNIEYVYSLTGDGTNIYAGLGSTAGDADVWRWDGSTWTQVGGDGVGSPASWSTSYEYVYSLLYQNGTLYAGLGLTAGDAEVWSCTNCNSGTPNWTKIGGDTVGWGTTYEGVYSLRGDGTNVFAGLGLTGGEDEIWQWNGSTWTQIGGDGVNGSFNTIAANTHGTVASMYYANNKLYAGITSSNSAYSSELWEYDTTALPSPTWTWLGGDFKNDSWGKRGINSVEVLQVSGDALYAGMGYQYPGNAMVWKMQDNSWDLVGGQGINASWNPFIYEKVSSMQSFNGKLYVGMGVTANDADLYELDGNTWSQVGGDGMGWSTNYEEVLSQAILNDYLFVGLGSSTDDGEVWRYDGSSWLKVGGDNGNAGTNGSWTGLDNIEQVLSLQPYHGKLYAGIGNTDGDAAVWECTDCADPVATPSWTKVAGGGINGSWTTSSLDGFNNVDAMVVFQDTLVASLGTETGEAEVWTYDGSTWTQIGGGNNLNGSWDAGSYERVRTIGVYNGQLYAGLGNSTGDGEVWRYNGSTWTKVAGDGTGWGVNTYEELNSFSVFEGKLFMGTGNTAGVDAAVWYTGNNRVLESSTTTQDDQWHHIAATYDGTTMNLYRDGSSIGSLTTTVAMKDSASPLMIGATQAGREFGKPRGTLGGMLDEIRISNTQRSGFITTPYTATAQTVTPNSPVFTSGVKSYDAFTVTENAGTGSITYRLSNDAGANWQYWNGSSWTTSSAVAQANDASTINSNIGTFPASAQGILWQGVLTSDGTVSPTLSDVTIGIVEDVTQPSNPTDLTALSSAGGTAITSDTWYTGAAPSFSWTGADDGSGSGVAGYYVYFGTDDTADPSTAGVFQSASTYTAASLSSGSTYYLRIKAKDSAQNTQSSTWAPFTYQFDNTAPSNPSSITVSPAGYAPSNEFTFSWPAASDTGSGVAGYQYKTATSSGTLSDWSATSSARLVTISEAAYKTDENVFYLRTVDTAGNTSTASLQANYYFAGAGASAPQFLAVSPAENTANSFAFSWQAPETFLGDASELTYCYSVNTLPTEDTCSFTSAGATSLSSSSFATQVGLNIFYLVAKNPESSGGTINYGAYATVSFTANTAAPGIPLNTDIADISVKSIPSWKLALSWEPPTVGGSSVSYYQIDRSTDGSTFAKIGTTTGTASVDSQLDQQTYYYKIRACDNVNNCGAYSEIVEMYPDGKYTTPPELSSGPEVTGITTKKATISWSTDRTADSKIQYGTAPGDYFPSEPSSSVQTTDHVVELSNLDPGTTYYYVAKWTDEDGNTGSSSEEAFTTEPAPSVKDVSVKNIGLTSGTVQFTSTGATSVKIYYGETTAFGGVVTVATSTSESTYTVELSDLADGTKYYYQINALDAEGSEYEGTILNFTTLPRPKISTVRIQQVRNTAQPTILVTWNTNTPTSSIVTIYPQDSPASARDEVNVTLQDKEHRMLIRGLLPETPYVVLVKGIDKAGNQATAEPQTLNTATDTRPAQISDLRVEGELQPVSDGETQNATAQLIASWTTDEPATTQVEFGEGSGNTYSQNTNEDSNLTLNHFVVIPGLSPSKVYHLRAISKDKANNESKSVDTVAITPKATDNALNLVITNLNQVFGFLRTQ